MCFLSLFILINHAHIAMSLRILSNNIFDVSKVFRDTNRNFLSVHFTPFLSRAATLLRNPSNYLCFSYTGTTAWVI